MVETERYLARAPTFQPAFNPWYQSQQGSFSRTVTLLDKAIECGHSEVIDWLYDWPNASQMRATLAFLFAETCANAMRVNNLPIVDMLLSSRIFRDVVPDENKQAMLNRLLQSEQAFKSSDMLELLIAHGANISSPATLATCAGAANLEQVEVLLRNGASVVGYEVLSEPTLKCKADAVSRLIACGADANGTNGLALYRAALNTDYTIVKALLEDGFADAGAESLYGQTALSAATTRTRSITPSARWRETIPLHKAQPISTSLARVKDILLQHGADPSHDHSRSKWW